MYEWMVRKAALADQTRPGIPVVDVETVEAAWKAAQARIVGEVRGRRGPGRVRSVLARVALLRDLAGMRYRAITARLGSSPTEARTRSLLHSECVSCDEACAMGVASIAHAALVAAYPMIRPRPRDGKTSQP